MYLTTRYKRHRELVRDLIPKVSRTFAINIRTLKYEEEIIIAVAYLICRYLDTIEDSTVLNNQEKIDFFEEVEEIFTTQTNAQVNDWPKKFQAISQKKKVISTSEAENQLWQKFNLVIEIYLAFPLKVQSILLPPIITMGKGMKSFLVKYQDQKEKVIMDQKEMEEYCYYVAGTVGEMLTNFFCLKIENQAVRANLSQRQLSFGLGLQMINILKDFFTDRKRGWVYLPKQNIESNSLTLKEFFSFDFEKKEKILQVYHDLIKEADDNLEKSMIYITYLPKKLLHYRLFCLIPLMLAIKTSSLLKKQKDFKKFKKKISKREVIFTLFLSRVIVFSNFLIKKYFYFYKN